MNEYCQILGYSSIRREFYLTWLPMIRPILLRRPPQSNYPPDAVSAPDYGSGLEAQNTKGGIPRLTPRGLASPLQSLPPILDNVHQTSTSSCSKGSRGLSVQPRVIGIFTDTTISPDPSLRQRPTRYAIRAGRNFAFPLRFRRRRLSLHPDADSRESLQLCIALCHWDSSH